MTAIELNKLILVTLIELLKVNKDYKGRTICLFSLADDGRGKYVCTFLDKRTSLAPRFLIAKDHLEFYGKPTITGILKNLLTSLTGAIKRSKPNPFNNIKAPLSARGRFSILDGKVNVDINTKIEVYSWSKVIK